EAAPTSPNERVYHPPASGPSVLGSHATAAFIAARANHARRQHGARSRRTARSYYLRRAVSRTVATRRRAGDVPARRATIRDRLRRRSHRLLLTRQVVRA